MRKTAGAIILLAVLVATSVAIRSDGPEIARATPVVLAQESARESVEPPVKAVPVPRNSITGDRIVDPTENVKALQEASSKRQDDLRAKESDLYDEKIRRMEAEWRHLDALRIADLRRVDEQLALRAAYEEKLQIAEAKRIDAIRAVDVNAVTVASQRAADQANVLAAQVSQSAEALRALVASTAVSVAGSQQQLANTLSARLTALEQSQYERTGKQSFSDPATERLLAEVAALRQQQATGAGKSEGISTSWFILLGVVSLVGALTTIASVVYAFMKAPASKK